MYVGLFKVEHGEVESMPIIGTLYSSNAILGGIISIIIYKVTQKSSLPISI
jgi:hypothetical protein